MSEALAVVLRSYSQTLVIEKEQDVNQLIIFAENKGIQDFSLLCIEWMQKFKHHPLQSQTSLFKGFISNEVSQHFLESVVLVSSHQEALDSWFKGICHESWSIQGIFLDHRGVLFKIKPSENQVFIRESEIAHLEKEFIQTEEQFLKLEQALQHLKHRRSHLRLERVEMDKIFRRDEMKLVEVNFGLQRILSDQEKNQTDRIHYTQDLDHSKQHLEKQKIAFQSLEQQLFQSKQELMHSQKIKDQLQIDLDRHESAYKYKCKIKKKEELFISS